MSEVSQRVATAERFLEGMYEAARQKGEFRDAISVWALVGQGVWNTVEERSGPLVIDHRAGGRQECCGVRCEVTGEPWHFQIVIRDEQTGKCRVIT